MFWSVNNPFVFVWILPHCFSDICQVAAQQGYYLADCFNKMYHCVEHPEGPLRLTGSGEGHHNFRPFRYLAFHYSYTCTHILTSSYGPERHNLYFKLCTAFWAHHNSR